jgi:hypothetical protein
VLTILGWIFVGDSVEGLNVCMMLGDILVVGVVLGTTVVGISLGSFEGEFVEGRKVGPILGWRGEDDNVGSADGESEVVGRLVRLGPLVVGFAVGDVEGDLDI